MTKKETKANLGKALDSAIANATQALDDYLESLGDIAQEAKDEAVKIGEHMLTIQEKLINGDMYYMDAEYAMKANISALKSIANKAKKQEAKVRAEHFSKLAFSLLRSLAGLLRQIPL